MLANLSRKIRLLCDLKQRGSPHLALWLWGKDFGIIRTINSTRHIMLNLAIRCYPLPELSRMT